MEIYIVIQCFKKSGLNSELIITLFDYVIFYISRTRGHINALGDPNEVLFLTNRNINVDISGLVKNRQTKTFDSRKCFYKRRKIVNIGSIIFLSMFSVKCRGIHRNAGGRPPQGGDS